MDHIGAAQEEQPIMVHVRRGDYRQGGFGLLGPRYYRNALRQLRAVGIDRPVWIFSDEPSSTPDYLLNLGRMVSSPIGAHEEMYLMSFGAANVIANSTFSWWGAWMNPDDVPVIYPKPWFRQSGEIQGLLPPWWLPEESAWVDA